jgi:hypothetical protein
VLDVERAPEEVLHGLDVVVGEGVGVRPVRHGSLEEGCVRGVGRGEFLQLEDHGVG